MTLSKQDKVTIMNRVMTALFKGPFNDLQKKLDEAKNALNKSAQTNFQNLKNSAPDHLRPFIKPTTTYVWDAANVDSFSGSSYYIHFEGQHVWTFVVNLHNGSNHDFVVNPSTKNILANEQFVVTYNKVCEEAKALVKDVEDTAKKTELILSSVSTLNQLLETWPAARTSVPREMFTREEERKKREKERREQAKRERVLREQKRKLELEEKLQDISDLDTRIFAASLAGDLDG